MNARTLSIALFSPALLVGVAAGQSITSTTIDVNVDGADTVVGLPVTIAQGNRTWGLTTDADGRTAPLVLDVHQPFEVVLHEGASPNGGSTVGQHLVWDNQAHSPSVLDVLDLSLSVPECRPLVKSKQHGKNYFSDGRSGYWFGRMSGDSWFSTAPQVAFVPGTAAVESYLNYAGETSVASAPFGFIFRSETNVVLPPEGVLFFASLRPYLFGAGVESLYIGDGPAGAGLNAAIIGEDYVPVGATDDFMIHLTGELKKGDNVLLLTGAQVAGGSSAGATVSGPAGATPSGSGSGGGSAAASSTCTPTAPDCSATCSPAAPESSCHGPIFMLTEDVSESTPLDGINCESDPDGDGCSLTTGAGTSWSFSLYAEREGVGFSPTFSVIRYTEHTGTGGNCECVKNFRCDPKARSKWHVHRLVYSSFLGELDVECVQFKQWTSCSGESVVDDNTCTIPGCETVD